jgi:hypothetical protein
VASDVSERYQTDIMQEWATAHDLGTILLFENHLQDNGVDSEIEVFHHR